MSSKSAKRRRAMEKKEPSYVDKVPEWLVRLVNKHTRQWGNENKKVIILTHDEVCKARD